MTTPVWPDGKKVAIYVNVAFEAWSPGTALGCRRWATRCRRPGRHGAGSGAVRVPPGIWRLLDTLERLAHATVMVSGLLTELAPDAVRAVVAAAMRSAGTAGSRKQLPAQLAPEAEAAMIAAACARSGDGAQQISGWISPRCTPRPGHVRSAARTAA